MPIQIHFSKPKYNSFENMQYECERSAHFNTQDTKGLEAKCFDGIMLNWLGNKANL